MVPIYRRYLSVPFVVLRTLYEAPPTGVDGLDSASVDGKPWGSYGSPEAFDPLAVAVTAGLLEDVDEP